MSPTRADAARAAAGASLRAAGAGDAREGTLGAPLAAEIKRYAFVRWLLRLLGASLALNAFAAAVLVLAGVLAMRRPPQHLVAEPSLKSAASALFGHDTQVNVDDLLLYLNTVLPLLHRLDDRGAPDLPLLRGLISAREYEIAAAEAARDVALARKNFVVQSLILTRVDDVAADNDHGRISAYVRGYLAILVQSTSRAVVLPYRAEVLLEMAPPSRLNRFPFVLIKRQWKINQAALEWDKARAPAAEGTIPAKRPAAKPERRPGREAPDA